jgi:hypothetical protein
MRATGAKVVVIQDMARAPRQVVDCVAEHSKRLSRCAFRPSRDGGAAFDKKGARGIEGVKVVDPIPRFCPRQRGDGRLCPAVIGNVLVYRNAYHLSATFAKTLAPWLGRKLPKLQSRGP